MQLNWFLKSKFKLRTWLNKLKIESFGNKAFFFCAILFKWNSAFCTKWLCFVHCYKKKKKRDRLNKTVLFWWHCLSSSSSGRVAGRERRFSSPSLPHLSLPHLPKNPNTTHTLLMAYHRDKKNRGDKHCGHPWGGCTVAAQATLPLRHDWTGVG
jgi:hypothetical protein